MTCCSMIILLLSFTCAVIGGIVMIIIVHMTMSCNKPSYSCQTIEGNKAIYSKEARTLVA